MKKQFFFTIAFLATIVFVAGCVKHSPTPDPVPTPIDPVITVTGIPTSPIPFGDSVTFSWSIKNYVSATLNGSSIPSDGTKTTSRIIKDSVFNIKATGPNGGKAQKSFTVQVKDWTSSNYGMISHSYWRIFAEGYKTDTMSKYEITDSTEMSSDLLAMKQYFYPDGVYEAISSNGLSGKNQWNLVGDSLEIGSTYPAKYLLDSITKTKMLLIEKSTATIYGKEVPALYIYFYKH